VPRGGPPQRDTKKRQISKRAMIAGQHEAGLQSVQMSGADHDRAWDGHAVQQVEG
jgi:hypothetical protein